MLNFAKKHGASSAGLAGWLLARFARQTPRRPRLTLIERITLAPRQSLALVEVEGRKFLVACSSDGTPAFLPLAGAREQTRRTQRVSW